jgi:hypothetical protein
LCCKLLIYIYIVGGEGGNSSKLVILQRQGTLLNHWKPIV